MAFLDAPVVEGDRVIIPQGTEFHGHVVEARRSGRLKGRATMEVTLDSFQLLTNIGSQLWRPAPVPLPGGGGNRWYLIPGSVFFASVQGDVDDLGDPLCLSNVSFLGRAVPCRWPSRCWSSRRRW